ncbi:MAG: hypothetical protein LRY73_09200 [Bacillus sp. (in: Bacteria)]|nr:hypothetical protein [Bacillus sp. (in: firmicutes)]
MLKSKVISFLSIYTIIFLSLNVLFFLSTWLIGYIMTVLYVPDIVDAYEDVTYLQNEVTMGVIYIGPWWANPFTIFSVIASLLLSIYIYKVRRKVRQ